MPNWWRSAVRPYLWLMERCAGDGLQLTQAGRLRPDEVKALMDELGWSRDWIGTSNRENQTAQALRLVRRFKGRLVLSPAGRDCSGDPLKLWGHIARSLPIERTDHDLLAVAARLLWAVAQPPQDESRGAFTAISAVLVRSNGSPLTEADVAWLGLGTGHVFGMLGGGGLWSVDPRLRRALAADIFRPHLQAVHEQQQPRRSPDQIPCHTLKLTLRTVAPAVWRRVQVPSDIPLPELADVLIAAMGWAGYHLWAFRQGRASYLRPDPDWPGDNLDAEPLHAGRRPAPGGLSRRLRIRLRRRVGA